MFQTLITHKTHHRTMVNHHRTMEWHSDVTIEPIMMSEVIITLYK